MGKRKSADAIVFVAFKSKDAATEILKNWLIAQDEEENQYSIHDVLNNRERWRAVPVTFYENSLNMILEIPCDVEQLQSYIDKCRLYLGDNGAVVGCTWVGKAKTFTVCYQLGAERKDFQVTIDTFVPLSVAKEEFLTLREILYTATMERLFGKEMQNLTSEEQSWLALFAPIN